MSADTPVFTLGHSPDPDDAFMFYAMAENKIDLRGYRFDHRVQDIQTLNERARRGELHISAISIHAYAFVTDKYALLPCGASMGDGYGPLLIAKPPTIDNEKDARAFLRQCVIPVPGRMTSAFLALQLYLGDFKHIVVPFDQIFDSVRSGAAEAGLIIHEGQLTYANSGMECMVDLGAWWKERTGLPLPLGGNVIRKDIPTAVQRDLIEILKESVDFALSHRAPAVQHSLPYARDMDADLAGKFIGMYVNEFTRDYGEVGRTAIRRFLDESQRAGFLPKKVDLEFAG